jgi:starch synthase (maltosyl-transferring)
MRKLAPSSRRIVIDQIWPAVDGGRFAAKRVIGETVVVEADVFTDGHDVIAVELLWRAADEEEWHRAQMGPLGNDRWQAAILPKRIGRHLYTVEAWWDGYATFCRDLDVKHKAGADLKLELEEGHQLLAQAERRADGRAKEVIEIALASLCATCMPRNVEVLLAPDLREAMASCDERPFRHRHDPVLPIEVERPQANFASWYELFPRSATDDPRRHGTFTGVIARLPAIRDMGFDVLYLPPIHPIGTTNRKGRNNSLRAEPDDVGSVYAIGSREGGHDAIHPALGTIEDFRRLRDAAVAHGLELALDFAIQCSPDHPWLKEHPEWFRWRPDGLVRFAENPPKKYEDIVNVDFYAEGAIPDLWNALRDVVLHWASEGVRIFRVDNPHTKPLPFWEWALADVRARYPDVIFLSEAFTRPKMMYRLAKVGFAQSYTYFTWRNSKQELTDYLIELTTSDVREYFRPHLFVNTPDINPFFLQNSGRAGFLIRAALAATLSGLWGMYSGFELCESAPLPGREEYLDSEKYQIRVRDYNAPGNIVDEIASLNRIRRSNPALQTHKGLRFYNAFNDRVIYYGKPLPARDDMILVAVSLDPHGVQEAIVEVPLWEWGLPDSGSVLVEDLMRHTSFVWSGKLQRVRLDPAELPFSIWRITPARGG